MRVASQHANALGCTSGPWRIWSLSDGYVDMPAELLKAPDGGVAGIPRSFDRIGTMIRLSVNCFLLDGPGADKVLVDCGAGTSWDATMGHLDTAMAEAGIDPASITTVALTHTHTDHIYGLLTRDGQEAFTNLRRIVIAKEAAAGFLAKSNLERFRPRLTPIEGGHQVTDGLLAVAMPGHAPGHMGYRLDTGEDRLLFCGDVIHVPAAQFARPELTWGNDHSQPVARVTRIDLLRDAASTGTWLAGAHTGWPGIGRIASDGQGYAYNPVV